MRFNIAVALAGVACLADARLGNPKGVTTTEEQRVREIKARIATESNLSP